MPEEARPDDGLPEAGGGLPKAGASSHGGGGDAPITPHAAPCLDPQGRLTYIGEDGRRYVVASPPEEEAPPTAP